MNRLEALEKAREIVASMATNNRGFMDGASFNDRVSATERLANFLLGDDESEGK